MKQKARILFYKSGDNLFLADAYGISTELWRHLNEDPPHIEDDTHLARFFRGNGPASGKLENAMPGSAFENFEFERHTFGTGDDTIDVIVGWYW